MKFISIISLSKHQFHPQRVNWMVRFKPVSPSRRRRGVSVWHGDGHPLHGPHAEEEDHRPSPSHRAAAGIHKVLLLLSRWAAGGLWRGDGAR